MVMVTFRDPERIGIVVKVVATEHADAGCSAAQPMTCLLHSRSSS